MSVMPSGGWIWDWQAIATLVTGLSAVGAALCVGARQTKILRRQSAIASRLAEIERAKIRFELFDRRFQFVMAFDAFVMRVRSKRDFLADEDVAFVVATNEAKFLFPRSIKPLIDELWDTAVLYQEAGDNLASDDEAVAQNAREDRKKVRCDLDDLVSRFSEMFDAEMRPFD